MSKPKKYFKIQFKQDTGSSAAHGHLWELREIPIKYLDVAHVIVRRLKKAPKGDGDTVSYRCAGIRCSDCPLDGDLYPGQPNCTDVTLGENYIRSSVKIFE